MSEYRLYRDEKETIILGSAASRTWDICTADPRIIRKMKMQGYKPDNKTNPWGYASFTLPFEKVRIVKAEKRKTSGRPFQSISSANSRKF
jgi:hypothetical protein